MIVQWEVQGNCLPYYEISASLGYSKLLAITPIITFIITPISSYNCNYKSSSFGFTCLLFVS